MSRSLTSLSLRLVAGLGIFLFGAIPAIACAVFTAPTIYLKANATIDFDASPQAQAIRVLAFQQYTSVVAAAVKMESKIDLLLRKPTDENLRHAQDAWKQAKSLYQLTEWTRFTESPIDWAEIGARPAGPETRINAWPLNEAVIDYVRGAPTAGLVYRLELPMSKANILANDQLTDEADVTTGWHAIEFLLWGQDFSLKHAGQRPIADFQLATKSTSSKIVERRRDYLRAVTSLLIEDLMLVRAEWNPGDPESYASKLSQIPAIEQVGRAMHGATTLLMTELYGQRLITPLDSGSSEDEHSCFSDFTLQDLRANLEGVQLLYFAGGEGSLMSLIHWRDPALHARLEAQFATSKRALAQIPEPFDAVLASSPGSDGRRAAEKAGDELQRLGLLLKTAAEVLSIDIVVPGV
jgi:putative iron-regulated protein